MNLPDFSDMLEKFSPQIQLFGIIYIDTVVDMKSFFNGVVERRNCHEELFNLIEIELISEDNKNNNNFAAFNNKLIELE